jgi:hypothetical protein
VMVETRTGRRLRVATGSLRLSARRRQVSRSHIAARDWILQTDRFVCGSVV